VNFGPLQVSIRYVVQKGGMEVICDVKLCTCYLSARIFGHIIYIADGPCYCVCTQYTECPANYENFVTASGSCLLIRTDSFLNVPLKRSTR